MHIGRICGNDTEDLVYISWKIQQNEMNPYQPAGENWFMKGFSMACTSPMNAAYESLMLHQLFHANAIDSDFYCNALGGATPDHDQIISDINEGRQVINYIGHGDPTSWVTSSFTNSNIAALTNGRRMPWVFTIGCQNGEFDHYYCFCEAFLSEGTIADPRGAMTIMGSSTYTPVGPGDTLQIHTFRGYFTEELHHLGVTYVDPAVAIGDASSSTVTSFFLKMPSPNPVSTTSSIEFALPSAGEANLAVYDIAGRRIFSFEPGELEAGIHTFSWSGTSDSGETVPNGVYFMKLTVPSTGTLRQTFLVVR